MNLSQEESTEILSALLVNDDAELISAFMQPDISLKPNQIIRQLCNQTILRDLEKALSFDYVIVYTIVNGKFGVDFYSSFDRLTAKIDELMPLIKVVGWVYGEDCRTVQRGA